MAEQDVINRIKNILKHSRNNKNSFWKKVREIILEILIIVFAVSISIWFQNLNIKKVNKRTEKEFFKDLIVDLKKDVVEWKKEKDFYINQIAILDYQICLGEQKNNCNAVKKEFDSYSLIIPKYTPVHNSYFDAAKSSGIFSIISNKELLIEIVNYYQEAIPFIKSQKAVFNEENNRLLIAFKENATFLPDGTYDFKIMMKKPAILFQVKMMKNSIYIVEHYNDIIAKTEKLIAKIENEKHI